jgi:hypothetical protein
MEEPGHSQRRKAVQMKRHHKKMVEAYRNFESIFQVINLKNIDLESCRYKILNLPESKMNFDLR